MDRLKEILIYIISKIGNIKSIIAKFLIMFTIYLVSGLGFGFFMVCFIGWFFTELITMIDNSEKFSDHNSITVAKLREMLDELGPQERQQFIGWILDNDSESEYRRENTGLKSMHSFLKTTYHEKKSHYNGAAINNISTMPGTKTE